MQQMMVGDLIITHHSEQHYRTLFNQKTGMFIRKEEKGYEEPFWSKDGPELLDMSITNYCERGCGFCYRQSDSNGAHMALSDLQRVVEQAQELGVLQIALGGGNPNQHPEFCDILRSIRVHNIVPSYTTNGDGLTDEILQCTAENCGAMAVSAYPPFDARFEEKIRRIASFGIRLNLHMILKEDTIDIAISWMQDPPKFLQYVNAIIFLNYKPINRNYRLQPIDGIKLRQFFQSASDCKVVKIGFDSCSISGIVQMMDVPTYLIESCEAARFSAFISEDLKMYPCSFMVGADMYGDLRKNTMLDIWQSNASFVEFRDRIKNNSCADCRFEGLCKGGCRFLPEINMCHKKMPKKEIKTVEDLFADGEKVVYHYFPASIKETILKEGLRCAKDQCAKNGMKKGIYVVWSDDIRVRNAIVESQVSVDASFKPVGKICQLAINLQKYGITAKDIAPDLNGGAECDINSFCCKIVKDIPHIDPSDISNWEGGSADTYGVEFYNLEGYNIDYMPKDYENGVANGWYPKIVWKKYE